MSKTGRRLFGSAFSTWLAGVVRISRLLRNYLFERFLHRELLDSEVLAAAQADRAAEGSKLDQTGGCVGDVEEGMVRFAV